MKNSLFKRAVAAAAAVPLALTQCLTTSFAVSVDTADLAKSGAVQAESNVKSITLDKILYIAPQETESSWNTLVASFIEFAEDQGKSHGTIDAAKFVDSIVSYAGPYEEAAKQVAARLLDEDVTYDITDGDLIINGKVTQPNLNGNWDKTPGQALSQIAKEYNAPALNNVDFSSVKIGGSFTITIKSSALNDGTTVPVEFKYKNDAGEFGPGETFAYGAKCLQQIKEIGEAAIKKEVAADKADEAVAKFDAKIAQLENKVRIAANIYKSAMTKSVSYSSVAEAAEATTKFLNRHKIDRTVPSTAAEIAAKKTVANAYSTALEMVNNAAAPNSVDITAAELGTFIDNLNDFNVALSDKKVTVYGTFEDAEADAVKEYYNVTKADDPNFGTYVSSYKIFEGAANFADIDAKGGDVDVKIKRVVVTDTKTTTSTTTTTAPVDTTTTTTTTEPVDTTSTTTTTAPVDTTSTTTTTAPVDTTSTTTTTAPVDTTSTTTTTEPVDTTTTTTVTGKKTVEVTRYATVKTSAGFYLDTDEAFNEAQIEEAMLYIKTQDIAIDEAGNEIKDDNGNLIVLGETTENAVDITDRLTFGDATPSNTYSASETDFKYEIPVYYRNDVLKDVEGYDITVDVYIGVKGDADLSNEVDGSDATLILKYFGSTQASSGGFVDRNTIQMNNINPVVTGPESIYDEFSVFLADVDSKLTDNWKPGKKNDRAIDGADATLDLKYFGITTNNHKYGKETWDEILGTLGQ